jgi:NADH-quinone oxidoreductase subunit G
VLRQGELKRFRPRYDEEVNGYWMCDVGRFALEQPSRPDRLVGASVHSETRGREPVDVYTALELVRDMFLTHTEILVVASPFITVEEGRDLIALGKTLGARPVFVSPERNDLADDLLHTGDGCPNRRGLTDLGFDALPAEEVLAAAEDNEVVLLVGERVVDLLGAQHVTELTDRARVVLLETCGAPGAAIDVTIGIPNHIERVGTWVNVDGIERRIAQARPAPAGVWTTCRLLDTLHGLVTGAQAATS